MDGNPASSRMNRNSQNRQHQQQQQHRQQQQHTEQQQRDVSPIDTHNPFAVLDTEAGRQFDN